jgi:asparagine synthase (glutamine-hydrolysing)
MIRWDLEHYLSDDVMAKVDRTTKAVSLEGREPLLDRCLIEFAFRLPLSLRLGTLGSKHLLRVICRRHVPESLVNRPKAGVSVPLRDWLSGTVVSDVSAALDATRIRRQGIFFPSEVARVVNEFRSHHGSDVNRCWYLVAFQL